MPPSKQNVLDWQTNFCCRLLTLYFGVRGNLSQILFMQQSPEELLKFNRSHWSCENNLNWIKDKVFEEDKSTISTGEAPLIMSLLRTITLAIIALFSNKITETRENFNNYRHRLFKLFST